jgi:serine/threonine protein kinase
VIGNYISFYDTSQSKPQILTVLKEESVRKAIGAFIFSPAIRGNTMESIKLFLKEVTEELLYNIVYDENEIDYRNLSMIFEQKTGYEPMDFFGFGNQTGSGWMQFIRGIPGVQGKKNICIEDSNDVYDDSNSDDSENEDHVYKVFNSTYLYVATAGISVAEYREMILIKCCEMMKDNFADLSSCKDANGNTPLHLIAALPGITCDTLVKYLLQAGVDPLAANDGGQTFLHIIFGRFQAQNVANGAPVFKNERLPLTRWFVQDRVELLEMFSQELSPTYTTLLAKAQDNNGNTVLHEYALSTIVEFVFVADKMCKKLLKFGASLRVTNNSGNVPLHYAYTPKLFKIFLQNGAVCRARNDRDESPVLFILKVSAGLAFAQTSATAELADQAFVKTTSTRSVPEAGKLLENLKSIVSQNKDAMETVWIPDVKGNVSIDIVLIAIRIGSYNLEDTESALFGEDEAYGIGATVLVAELRSSLVELLSEMLRNATISDMKRQNKKGQSFLHVLLDVGDDNKHTIIRENNICQSVEILLEHGADVNTVDSEGRTPLDIAHKYHDKRLSLDQKCAALLIKHGANGKRNKRNISSLPSPLTPSPSISEGMSNLRILSEVRKLRSCPTRHFNNAKRLTDPATKVTVVGKYRYSNQDLIGSGGFSSIFLAIKDENVDSGSGTIECRAYALKRIEKAKMNPKEIKREITTLLSISGKCENIIKCHEPVEDDNFQYLCLDLMDGDLNEFVTNDNVNKVLKSNPATGAQITTEIINGLIFLHEQKFIHRDLKPGNILYTTDPTLHFKIADFGLTKNTSSSSSMTSTRGSGVAMAPGTRCWMAPELVSRNSREHTQQSDVFSMGLVLHYLLTLGKHPFTTGNEEPAHVIERKIVEMPANLDRALRAEVTSFLQVLLTRVPSKRPPAAYLNQHPYLWSDKKKMEFLKAVGDQQEAAYPANNPNSALELRLQATNTGQSVRFISWDLAIGKLYEEITKAWKSKKYRTDKVIDLIRFIRNAYAHKQERSHQTKQDLVDNIFIRVYPSLVLDVFGVVQGLGFEETRSSIREALSSNT